MSVFVDTGVFIAFHNTRDRNHNRAVELIRSIVNGELGTAYTSDYIFDEAVTYTLMKTKDIKKAMDVGRLILGDDELPRFVNMIVVDFPIFKKAWKLFLKYKKLSFTDCTSITLVQENEIERIMSFDSDFDGIISRVC